MTLRDSFDWLRIRLQVPTAIELKIPGARAGDESTIWPDPSNHKLRSAIFTAGKIVNQHVNLSDAGRIVKYAIPAQTENGPFQIDLGSVPGIPDRSIRSIRRAWWWDGEQATRLTPFLLSRSDLEGGWYLSDPPSTPMRFAIEGYTLYLDYPPASAGEIRFMAGSGVLTPVDDDDEFDQIPEDYDICVLYIALVELGKMNMTDATMNQRAANYAPDAAAGLERLAAWFNGGSSEQVPASMLVDTRSMRRLRIRH